MKKIFKSAVFLLLVISITFGSVINAFAETACDHTISSSLLTEGIYDYVIYPDGVCITAISGELRGNITIPSHIAEKPVTTIGIALFKGNTEIISVKLPDTLKTIDGKAFEGCTALKEITIPDSVTRIVYDAFKDCSALQSVKLPAGLTSIEDSVFLGCTSLNTIELPESVNHVFHTAFSNTGIYNNEENWKNDVLYIGNFLYEAKNTVSGKYTVKNGTKHITRDAFSNNTNLTEVVIPEGVETIDYYAFYECKNLEKVTLPTSLKKIGGFAFYGTKIKSIIIPDSATTISEGVFQNCQELSDVTLPAKLTEISASLFENCSKLENISIPVSVEKIGDNAFKGTPYFTAKAKADNGVFYVNNILCKADTNLQGEYYVKAGTKTINPGAFSQCSKLTAVYLPETVTEIGYSAFFGCTGLTQFTFPEGIKKIEQNVLYNCDKIHTVNIPAGVIEISAGAIPEKAIKNINISEKNESFCVDGLILFNKDKTELIRCYDKTLTSYTVPKSVKVIKSFALAIESLQEIKLHDGIESIEADAFSFSGIENNKDNWDGDFLYIDNYLISAHTKGNAVIKDGTKLIADEAFADNYMLEEVTIPASVKYIGLHSLRTCINLKKITVLSPDVIYGCSEQWPNTTVVYCYENSTTAAFCEEYCRRYVSLGAYKGIIITDKNIIREAAENIVIVPESVKAEAIFAAVAGNVSIINEKENVLAFEDTVSSGMILVVKDKDNKLITKRTIAIIGDADNNGILNSSDARLALRASVGLENLSDVQKIAANTDTSDTNITASDARIILRASVGLEDMKEIFAGY